MAGKAKNSKSRRGGAQKLSAKAGQTIEIESEGQAWKFSMPDWNQSGPLKQGPDRKSFEYRIDDKVLAGMAALYSIGCPHKVVAAASRIPWLAYRALLKRSPALKAFADSNRAKAIGSVQQVLFKAIHDSEPQLAIQWLDRWGGAKPASKALPQSHPAPIEAAYIMPSEDGEGDDAALKRFQKEIEPYMLAESGEGAEMGSEGDLSEG